MTRREIGRLVPHFARAARDDEATRNRIWELLENALETMEGRAATEWSSLVERLARNDPRRAAHLCGAALGMDERSRWRLRVSDVRELLQQIPTAGVLGWIDEFGIEVGGFGSDTSDRFRKEANEARRFLNHPHPRIREWAKREIAERSSVAEWVAREHAERFLP